MSGKTVRRLTGRSLALCLALVAAFLLSYCEGVYSSHGRVLVLGVESQNIHVFNEYLWAADRERNAALWHEVSGSPSAFKWRRLGFEFRCGEYVGSAHVRMNAAYSINYWAVAVPYWALIAPAAALPMGYWLLASRAGRRARKGLCAGCGYDLRATPGRCPECGTATPAVGGP